MTVWRECKKVLPASEEDCLVLWSKKSNPVRAYFDGEVFTCNTDGEEYNITPRWWTRYNTPNLSDEEIEAEKKIQVEFSAKRKQIEDDNNSVFSHAEAMKIVKKHLGCHE